MTYTKLLLVGAIAAMSMLTGCTTSHIKSPLFSDYPEMNVGSADLLARPTEYGVTIEDEIISGTSSTKRFLWIPIKGAKQYTINSRIVGAFTPGSSLQAEACKNIFDEHPDAEGLFVVRVVTGGKRTILPGTGVWDCTVYAKKLKLANYGVMDPERADILKGMREPAGSSEENTINLKIAK